MDEGMGMHNYLSRVNRMTTQVVNTRKQLRIKSETSFYKPVVQTILVKRIPLGLNDATIILLENDRFLKVENNVKR